MIRWNTTITSSKSKSPLPIEMTSFRGLLYLAVLFPFASDLVAGSLEVMVKDEKSGPVCDAVVYASGGATGSPSKKHTVIDQRDKQFVPYVTALQVGTPVLFPNSDNIRHHVYSFSSAKKFELPLYSGVPAQPVVFDKVGFVTLGCNIHDWMIAYVAVLPTPYFQVTGNDGSFDIQNVPPGTYTVTAWHELYGTSEQSVTIGPKESKTITITFKKISQRG